MNGVETLMDKYKCASIEYLVEILLKQPLINSLSNEGYSIAGPVTKQSHKEIIEKIIEFRTNQYAGRLDYLLSEEQLHIETTLDLESRSYYFYIEKNGLITACLRLTPYPFEFSALHSSLHQPSIEYSEFIELSRLVADTHSEHREITLGLITYACDWARLCGYQGIIALCSAAAQVMYSRYGLSNVTPGGFCELNIRNNKSYQLMAGSWDMLFFHTLKLFQHDRNIDKSINLMDPA